MNLKAGGIAGHVIAVGEPMLADGMLFRHRITWCQAFGVIQRPIWGSVAKR